MTEEEKMKMGYDLFVDAIAEFPFKNLWDFKETISAAARKLGKDETEVSEFLEDFFKDFTRRKRLLKKPNKGFGETVVTGFRSLFVAKNNEKDSR